MSELLTVDELCVAYVGGGGVRVRALAGASVGVNAGEVLGVLGESGSGKSTLAKTLLRVLPRNSVVTGGAIQFDGRELLALSEREMRRVRGAGMAMVPQEPGQALNPVMKVGDQIAEVIRAHRDWNWKRCRAEAESVLERVKLRSEGRRMYDAYPHQLSGGQQQRVAIGQAVACNPALIIADEPTASLDSTTEGEILELFRELRDERKISVILITHDPEILRGLADRVAVMYAGRVVEDAPTAQIFGNARHPYVRALLACVPPEVGVRTADYRLRTIAGAPPLNLESVSEGCSFSARCVERMDKCGSSRPVARELEAESRVECLLYDR
ncbi:MAG TPA: ABC transporter ATP-binding protein [Candidatus Acidoferrum sp.]|jgi:oligopeptide/dipeptide ABC transporter ATP-binding protein